MNRLPCSIPPTSQTRNRVDHSTAVGRRLNVLHQSGTMVPMNGCHCRVMNANHAPTSSKRSALASRTAVVSLAADAHGARTSRDRRKFSSASPTISSPTMEPPTLRVERARSPHGSSGTREWRSNSLTPTAARRNTRFLPGGRIPARVPRPAGGTVSPRVRRRRSPPSPRSGYRRGPAESAGPIHRDAVPQTRPASPPPRWRHHVRLHPRQLGPRQRPAGRQLVRRQQRDHVLLESGLLRRLHAAGGAGRVPDTDDQQHLLRHRRPGAAAIARIRRPARGRRIRAGKRSSDSPRPSHVRPAPARLVGTAGLENGALDDTPAHLPTVDRFAAWVDVAVGVEGRPEWVFVKVHSHGGPEGNASMLLGPVMEQFHTDINRRFNDGKQYRLHYVTAYEMACLVKAAEAGLTGSPRDLLKMAVV